MRTESNVPEIMRITADLNHDSITHAEPKAAMFLLFLVSGLTMLGTLTGTILALFYLERARSPHWLGGVLLFSLLGGVIGCGLGMLLLGLKGMLRWERQKHMQQAEQELRTPQS